MDPKQEFEDSLVEDYLQEIQISLKASRNSLLQQEVKVELGNLMTKLKGTKYFMPAVQFIGEIGFYTRDEKAILAAIKLTEEKTPVFPIDEENNLPGMALQTLAVLSQCWRKGRPLLSHSLLSELRSEKYDPEAAKLSADLALDIVSIIRQFYDPKATTVILHTAENICASSGENLLRKYLQIMNLEEVVRVVNSKRDYNSAYFLSPTTTPEGFNLVERIAAHYGESDSNEVIRFLRKSYDCDCYGKELETTASCVAEVAARTLDKEIISSVIKVASSYQFIELEQIMKAIQSNTALISEAIKVKNNFSHEINYEDAAAQVAKYGQRLAEAFSFDAVRKIGPYYRQRLRTINRGFSGYDCLLEKVFIEQMSASLGEIVVRTGSLEAIESVANFLLVDDPLESKSYVFRQVINTGNSELIKKRAEEYLVRRRNLN